MHSEQLDAHVLRRLQDRWTGDLMNQIVVALNEGRSIEPLLLTLQEAEGIPRVSERMDLRGINLSHQNLRGPWRVEDEVRQRVGVNLRNADLTGANLEWAILPRANLEGAVLRYADLSNAELIYADLREADLTGAVMKDVWLLYTHFQGAFVTEEQLRLRRNLGQLDFDYHAYEL